MSERDIWFISDTHFGHANILTFKNEEGHVRPEFSTVEEMDEAMLQGIAETVKPGDRLYHLGDVYFGTFPEGLPKIQAKKRLVLGNHDKPNDSRWKGCFSEVTSLRRLPQHNLILSHYPLHKTAIPSGFVNVHGHIHDRPAPSPRHVNVSVEVTGYRPVHIDDLFKDAS